MSNRGKQLTPEQFDQINHLYWEEGADQYDIAEMFGVDQSHISRIVRGIACSYHCIVTKKLDRLNQNIVPRKDEPAQARALRARRSTLHSTKLTWSQVVRIRKLYFTGKKTEMQLATMYGVNQSTISQLIQGRSWKIDDRS